MKDLLVSWNDLKKFANSRNISPQWVEINSKYYITALDGFYEINTIITRSSEPSSGSDQEDFEGNFKDIWNQSPSSQVTTQFEKRDKTLKIFHGAAAVGEDGTATILMKVPGEPGTADGRWISSGTAFFDTHTPGDVIKSVRFTDEDNLLGAGSGYIIGSYTDEEADESNQGWSVPPQGHIKAEAIGGYGFAPAGFYMKVVGKKGGGLTSGTLYVNIEWGKKE